MHYGITLWVDLLHSIACTTVLHSGHTFLNLRSQSLSATEKPQYCACSKLRDHNYRYIRVTEGYKVNWGNAEYTYQKIRTPAHAVNYYRSFLCERVFDPSDHKQHKFDSFTFMESATGS